MTTIAAPPALCAHGITAAHLDAWWGLVAREERIVATCACCGGPAPAVFVTADNGQQLGVNDRCRRCEEVGA